MTLCLLMVRAKKTGCQGRLDCRSSAGPGKSASCRFISRATTDRSRDVAATSAGLLAVIGSVACTVGVVREMLSAPFDSKQELAGHWEVAELEQDQRKERVAGRGAPGVESFESCDQADPCSVAERDQLPCPRAVRLLPEHPSGRLHPGDGERHRVIDVLRHRDAVADVEVLMFGQDLVGTRVAGVVDEVIRVPARPSVAELHKPWPDRLG